MFAQQMISSHPDVRGETNDALIRAIEEMLNCAQVCTSCADACLAEEMVAELRQCIRLNLDCADACFATARIATRRAGGNVEVIAPMLQACLEACRRCGQECRMHAEHMEHCRICAEACQRCEQACEAALSSLGATVQ
jgi:hypothetical protein